MSTVEYKCELLNRNMPTCEYKTELLNIKIQPLNINLNC